MDPNLQIRLAGLFLFGDQQNSTVNAMNGGPAAIDEFLGNEPGTTDVCDQTAYALSGTFTGPSQDAVQSAIDLLSTYAGSSNAFGFPTGQKFPFNYFFAPRWCYFLPEEFQPSAIAAAPGNMWQASYRLVMRQCSQ